MLKLTIKLMRRIHTGGDRDSNKVVDASSNEVGSDAPNSPL